MIMQWVRDIAGVISWIVIVYFVIRAAKALAEVFVKMMINAMKDDNTIERGNR